MDCRSRYNETPLHIACLRGNLEIADYLKQKGADMDATDNDGNTVLHYASSSNSQSMMKWLLSRPGVREKMNMKNKVSFKITCMFFDPSCKNMCFAKEIILCVTLWLYTWQHVHTHACTYTH